MTEKMSKDSALNRVVVPPAQPSPDAGAAPALDLDELERLEKAVAPGPFEARYVPSGMPVQCVKFGLIDLGQGGIEVSRHWTREDVEYSEALRNAAPQLLAIARAARELVRAWRDSPDPGEWVKKSLALRATLDTGADAAPASGDGSIGKQEKTDA
jgi:hypothetical protein